MTTLHDYQKRAINFALANRQSFMMVDKGLGKTAIALKTIERARIPALVIAPLRPVYQTWQEEIQKWTPDLKYTILHGDKKDIRLRLERDIYLLNYEGINWFFKACAYGKFKMRRLFMVFDESSFIKSSTTKRFKILKKMHPIFSQYRMNLSATPTPNGMHEIWPQMYLLDRGKRLGRNHGKFMKTWFEIDQYSRVTEPKPGTNERITSAISDVCFRLDSKDYAKLPELIYNKIYIEMPEKMRKYYKQLERDFFLDFEEGVSSAASAATLSSKLRQFLQGAMYLDRDDEGPKDYRVVHNLKVETLKELIATSHGQPILCPIQFRFELELIRKYYDHETPIIYGGTPAKEALRLIQEWNKGNLPLLLCHPLSLAHGVNLQAGGCIVVWMGLTWSLEQFDQLNGRLHRQGQKKAVIVNSLMFRDTIDEIVWKVLTKKNATQQDFLNAIKEYKYEV